MKTKRDNTLIGRKGRTRVGGETGEIVAFNVQTGIAFFLFDSGAFEGRTQQIAIEKIEITTCSPAEQDHAEVVDLLRQIKQAVELNNNHG